MRVIGDVSDEVRFAAEFFVGELIKDGRIRRHLNVEIVLDASLDGWAGICLSDEDRRKPKYFTITLNPVAGDHLLQCLAHELVHVKQFATGELYDRLNGVIEWKGQEFHGQVSYEGDIEDAPPWEQEAYAKEVDLFEEFLSLEVC